MPSDDLLHVGDQMLADIARHAFKLGLDDGAKLTKPRDSYAIVAALLGEPRDFTYRRFHRHKFRQVYGAGFDIARVSKVAKSKMDGRYSDLHH